MSFGTECEFEKAVNLSYLVLFGILAGEKFRYGMTFGYSTMNAAPKKALTV